jgi:O-antigen ligase
MKYIVIVSGLFGALILGYLSGFFGLALILLIAGLLLALVFLRNSFIGWLLFVGLIPFELGVSGSTTILRLLGFYLLGLWVIKLVAEKRPILIIPFAKWLVPFIIWAGLSYTWASEKNLIIQTWFTFLQMLALSLIIYNEIKTYKQLRWMFIVLFSSCLVVTLMGYLGIGSLDQTELLRIGNRGVKDTASLIGIALLSSMILFFLSKEKRYKLLFVLMSLMCIYPLLATGERGALVAIGVGLIVVELAVKRKFSTIIYILIGIFAAYISFQIVVEYGNLSNYVISRFNLNSILISGASGRDYIWKVAFQLFLGHPILGVGLGNFPNSFWSYTHENIQLLRSLPFIFAVGPHNDLIGVATELGIVGFVLIISLQISVAKRFFNSIKKITYSEIYILLVLLMGLSVYYFSVGMTSVLMDRKLYWLLLALVEVAIKLANERSGEIKNLSK